MYTGFVFDVKKEVFELATLNRLWFNIWHLKKVIHALYMYVNWVTIAWREIYINMCIVFILFASLRSTSTWQKVHRAHNSETNTAVSSYDYVTWDQYSYLTSDPVYAHHSWPMTPWVHKTCPQGQHCHIHLTA